MNIPPLLYIDNTLGPEAKKEYAKRRKTLAKSCQIPTLIIGPDTGPNGTEPWAHCNSPIYQEPLLLYLTGINQPRTALFIDPTTNDAVLFLPKYSAKSAFWDGKQICYNEDDNSKESRQLTGIKTIIDINDCHQFILEYVQEHKLKTLGMLWHQHPKTRRVFQDNTYKQKQRLKRKLPKFCTLQNISDQQWAQRAIATPIEETLATQAQTKTKTAFETTLKDLKHCKTENELAGTLQGELQKQSPYGLSFNPIVASEKNATILHYITNDAPIPKNCLILLDFGLNWHTVVSDISRTIPSHGKFNPLQALLYQIVLDTQIAVEKFIKPGKTIKECNHYCWETLESHLKERFFDQGGKAERDYKQSPHFVGHRIGIQVHDGDPFGLYRDAPLQAGTTISNEPGLYGTFEIKLNGKHYLETIGIRIEDNLRVTQTGIINLSKSIPKTIAQIESLIN